MSSVKLESIGVDQGENMVHSKAGGPGDLWIHDLCNLHRIYIYTQRDRERGQKERDIMLKILTPGQTYLRASASYHVGYLVVFGYDSYRLLTDITCAHRLRAKSVTSLGRKNKKTKNTYT